MNTNIELLIYNFEKNKVYQPDIEDGITLTSERQGSPATLSFKVAKTRDKDNDFVVNMGNGVSLKVNGHKMFYGFIFSRKHGFNRSIEVTAYDQLRYLKNKDTLVYENKTANEVIKMIAKDYNLKTGTLANTKFKIPSRVEDNTTLFDVINNALDLTTINTNQMYVLYDYYGKILLKSLSDMKVGTKEKYLLINNDSFSDYQIDTSIDDKTYNQIKLAYDNNDSGQREVYIAKSTKRINRYGVLQYYDKIQEDENGAEKAKQLLKIYQVPSKSFQLKGVRGDYRVRGGSMVVADIKIGLFKYKNWILVEKCKHEIKNNDWLMTLDLKGGDFNE